MGKVKCLSCNKILHSTHRHDFQKCECVNATFVDGGYDYTRIGGMILGLILCLPDENKIEESMEMAYEIRTCEINPYPKDDLIKMIEGYEQYINILEKHIKKPILE